MEEESKNGEELKNGEQVTSKELMKEIL